MFKRHSPIRSEAETSEQPVDPRVLAVDKALGAGIIVLLVGIVAALSVFLLLMQLGLV